MPNLQGQFHEGIGDYYSLQSFIYLLGDKFKESCYQYLEEFICDLYYPKCEGSTLVAVCRETCADFLNACVEEWLSVLEEVIPSEIKLQALKTKVENVLGEDFWISLCNYLPSKDGAIPCFYKPVTCEHRPKVKNSVVQSEAILGNQTYLINSQLIYSCENETETDDNKSIVTCLYSGKWSKPPQCKPKANPKSKSLNPLIVTIPVLGVPFVLITIMYCLFT